MAVLIQGEERRKMIVLVCGGLCVWYKGKGGRGKGDEDGWGMVG